MTKTNTQGATSRPAVDPQQSSKGTTLHYLQNTTVTQLKKEFESYYLKKTLSKLYPEYNDSQLAVFVLVIDLVKAGYQIEEATALLTEALAEVRNKTEEREEEPPHDTNHYQPEGGSR